jgi:ribosomal protein S18 acetylase RimI-like enzyme
MIPIVKASEMHADLLAGLAKLTFIESHGNSAAPADINAYVAEKYNNDVLRTELQDPRNIYHILYYNDRAAGYSKIILDAPFENSTIPNITKLERLYLLKEFYSLNLGSALFEFIIQLIKEKNQLGIWLFVWKENQRAVNFYKKHGFSIIGHHDFRISENHTNPNYQMFLRFN